MGFTNSLTQFRFLSELYAQDASDASLLAEYPSSNSRETNFQNRTKFVIHDPYPPPSRSLIKILGPHHLMCCWGNQIPVASEIAPPRFLVDHWRRLFGESGCPKWTEFESDAKYITLFPHESIPADCQVIDPNALYELHSKKVIEKIDCPQAVVLDSIEPPCIVKLSHGYAGLGNYFIHNQRDAEFADREIGKRWPQADRVINSIIDGVIGDFGIQFYLTRTGRIVWLGFTEQKFNESMRWSGGHFISQQQDELFDAFIPIVEPTASYLHRHGYFGVVGVDILQTKSNEFFLVDVNPRLTGITPFLLASRIFISEGFEEGIYRASCEFSGTCQQLIEFAESQTDARVLVLSAYHDAITGKSKCHISVSSNSIERCQTIFHEILETG